MATELYCSEDDVTNRLSADGVTYRDDDTPPDDLGDVIDMASREIDLWLLPAYTEANLQASVWVQHATADIATYFLCERRGNPVPQGIAQKFERLLGKNGDGKGGRLDMIRCERLHLPDVPRRRVSVPRMSNMRVRLDPFPRSVVERKRSQTREQPRDYAQHKDALDFFDYGANI